jgi:DNA transposition AAA+ family ATPase
MTSPKLDQETARTMQEKSLREEVRREMHVAGLSQTRLAREAGLSVARLRQWFSGKEPIQAPDITRKLMHWLHGVEERRAERSTGLIPEAPHWKPTPTGENIIAVFKYAQHMADMGIVYGGAGLGKTMTAVRYQEEAPNVWIATMTPSIMSVSACFERVAFAIGISSIPTSASRAENAVVARVQGSRGLIIVDEAQHLSVTCLDALRGLYDASGIGLVFMGNERVYAQLTGGSRKAHFAQLFSRIGRQLRLTAPVNGDIDTLLDAWGITEKQARALCREIGSKAGALRGLTKVLRQAGLMIDEADSAIRAEHVEAAWLELGGIALKKKKKRCDACWKRPALCAAERFLKINSGCVRTGAEKICACDARVSLPESTA